KDGQREFALSAAIGVEWGGTGASAVGSDSFSTITPSVLFGKGLGDLPDRMGWARPFALTGQISYSFPTRTSTNSVDPDTALSSSTPNPQFLTYGFTLQYSMPYLKSSVVDLDLPGFLNHLIPIVETQFATPVANKAGTGIGTTGTIKSRSDLGRKLFPSRSRSDRACKPCQWDRRRRFGAAAPVSRRYLSDDD